MDKCENCENIAEYLCIETNEKYCRNCKTLMNVNGAGIEIDDYHFRKLEHECNYVFSKFCGAYICTICNNHRGLARCFCGFGLQPNERLEDDIDY